MKTDPIISTKSLNVWYQDFHALKDISIDHPPQTINAIIGPSGCGKSTYIRCINRIYEQVPGARAEGEIFFMGKNILDPAVPKWSCAVRSAWSFKSPIRSLE